LRTITVIKYGSLQYEQMVALRDKVLRKPLGLSFTTEELAKDSNDILLGCFEGIEMIACLIITQLPNQTYKLRQMAVDESRQNNGIGREIIQFAETIAIENKVQLIELNARKVAVEFYLKLNYKIVGDIFFEVGIEHLRMEKNLQ